MKRLTLLLAVVLQLNAPGQSYKYEISHYPKRGSCHALASALAANVSEHLSTPAIGRCVDIGKSDFSIEIRYEADKELPIHSTYSSLSLIYDFSDYATETECNDALPGWVTMFERNTELTPLVAYCFNQHSSPGFKLNWAVRIDGIGKAVKRPIVRGMLIHGAPVDYPGESFVNAVKEKLEPAGVEFAHARFNYRAAEYQLDLVYYTGGPSLDSGRIAEYLNVGDCEAERESLNGMFGDSPSFIFCTKNYLQESNMMGIFSSGTPEIILSAERMDNYRECVAQKAEILQIYQGLGYANIVGGVCTLAGRDYKVAMVTRRSER